MPHTYLHMLCAMCLHVGVLFISSIEYISTHMMCPYVCMNARTFVIYIKYFTLLHNWIVCGLWMEKSEVAHYIESHLLQIIVFVTEKNSYSSSSIPDYYENCSEKQPEQMRYTHTHTACICKFRAYDCLLYVFP